MAVEDDVMKGTESSGNVEALDFRVSGEDEISPEDLAWVDSCLVKDPEISDSNLDSVKNVLLEVIDSHSETLVSSSSAGSNVNDSQLPERNQDKVVPMNLELERIIDTSPSTNFESVVQETSMEIPSLLSNKDANRASEGIEQEKLHFRGRNDDNDVEPETGNGRYQNDWRTRIFLSENLEGDTTIEKIPIDPFLPNYMEENEVGETFDSGFESDDSAVGTSPSPAEDIFRVWDLGILDEEEDEIVTQLKKALLDPKFQSRPAADDEPEAWKDIKDVSLHDLISGISGLSLNQTPKNLFHTHQVH